MDLSIQVRIQCGDLVLPALVIGIVTIVAGLDRNLKPAICTSTGHRVTPVMQDVYPSHNQV